MTFRQAFAQRMTELIGAVLGSVAVVTVCVGALVISLAIVGDQQPVLTLACAAGIGLIALALLFALLDTIAPDDRDP